MEEKKEGKNKKQIVIGITILLLVTLILLGLTYAYYRTKVIGNSGTKSISATATNLEVTYQDDNPSVIEKTVEPGDTFEKTFKVTYTGDGTAYYSIKLDNKENTFNRIFDWTYELTKDGEASPIATGELNGSDTQILKGLVKIEKKATHTYTLKVTYQNLEDVNQSEDMGATLSFRVNIGAALGEDLINAPSDTLLHAIGVNNEITDPLTVPGKALSGYSWKDSTISDGTETFDVDSSRQSYYWTYGDGYTYDPESGMFKLTGVTKGQYSEIKDTLIGKYLVSYSADSNSSSSDVLKTTTGLSNVYKVESIASGTTDTITYKTISPQTIEEALLSYTEDDYGISYYYRGAVENNYVTFANMCWRIVRVQGDGSIKITLYDEKHDCKTSTTNPNGAFMSEDGKGEKTYSSTYSNSYGIKNVKFENSAIQSALEDWYGFEAINLETYANQIEQEAEWCNDVSVSGSSSGAYMRLGSLSVTGPSLKCSETSNTEMGSSKYTGKIALLTADEIAFAGLVLGSEYGIEIYSYLKENASGSSGYWSMSPAIIDPGWQSCYYVFGGRLLETAANGNPYGVRPAIVLKPTVKIAEGGTGTKTSPYVITQQ